MRECVVWEGVEELVITHLYYAVPDSTGDYLDANWMKGIEDIHDTIILIFTNNDSLYRIQRWLQPYFKRVRGGVVLQHVDCTHQDWPGSIRGKIDHRGGSATEMHSGRWS